MQALACLHHLVCLALHHIASPTLCVVLDLWCLQAEGVELMWLMMQNKKQSRYGALKLLDFACTRYTPPCEKLVDLVSECDLPAWCGLHELVKGSRMGDTCFDCVDVPIWSVRPQTGSIAQ
jgi:hypothetical protein